MMYDLAGLLTHPFTFCLLAMGVALIALWRSAASRWVKWAVTVPYAMLYLCGLHPFALLLIGSLENRHPAPAEWPAGTPVVVLSGGYVLPDRSRPEALPSPATSERLQHAAEVYRQAGRPLVICSGGRLVPEFPETDAAMMCRYLERFDVARADLAAEDNSRNTWQNAAESARILAERGSDRAIVVTHGVHMHRSILCLSKHGIACTPAPVFLRAAEFRFAWPLWFLPHIEALRMTHESVHEYLGLVWYWLCGRF